MHDSVPGDPMWLLEEDGIGIRAINVVKMTNVLSAAPTFTTNRVGVNPYLRAVPELQPNGTSDHYQDRFAHPQAADAEWTTSSPPIKSSMAAGNLDHVPWYVFNVSGGTPTLQQQGDISGGPGVYVAYPGIDINPQGTIGMSYIQSGTGAGQFMSTYITGRTATDAPGTMETAVLVQAGQANHTGSREGDLSGINVDSDGNFWIANEFNNTQAGVNWGSGRSAISRWAPPQIVLAGATEGVTLVDVPVATFIDNSGVDIGSYTANISWGDGTTTVGQVVANAGSTNTFTVLGSHTYSEEGNPTLTVSVSNGMTTLGPTSGVIRVNNAPLSAGSSQTLNAKVGSFLSDSLLATFTDTDQTNTPGDPQNNPADYSATINFFEPGGVFAAAWHIRAGEQYLRRLRQQPFHFSSAGTFTVRVIIRDVGGISVAVDDTVNVSDNPAIPPLVPLFQSDIGPRGPQFLAFQNALTNLITAERLFIASLTVAGPGWSAGNPQLDQCIPCSTSLPSPALI